MKSEIKLFLSKLPAQKSKLAKKIRSVILDADKKIVESIKWGNLTFSFNNTKLIILYTHQTTDYVNVGFLQATSLNDPDFLFEGTGKGMRHIKIRSEKDIHILQMKRWTKEAVRIVKCEE